MADETDAIAVWMNTYLTGDTQLMAAAPGGVHHGTALGPVAFPYVRFDIIPGADLVTSGLTRTLARATLWVRGINKQAPFSSLVTISNRIDALFGARSEWMAGQTLRITCERTKPLLFEEPPGVGGVIYRHRGGEYQLLLQPIPGS